jgi:hypothetical protein
MARKENRGHIGHAHRGAGVAGIGLLDCVHGRARMAFANWLCSAEEVAAFMVRLTPFGRAIE